MHFFLKTTLIAGLLTFGAAPSNLVIASDSDRPSQANSLEHHAMLAHNSETPSENKLEEHPVIPGHDHEAEHPAGKNSKKQSIKRAKISKITIKDVANAVRKFVAVDSKAKGGYFMIYDKVQKKPLALKLKKIHEDRLSSIGNKTYFVCADFDAADGKTYDIDLLMKEGLRDHLKLSGVITVHKVNGRARYGWIKKGGVWKHSPK